MKYRLIKYHHFFLFLLLAFYACNSNPNEGLQLVTKKKLSSENRDFILYMVPKIKEENKGILNTRKKIEYLDQHFDSTDFISRKKLKWLKKVSLDYGFKKLDFTRSIGYDQLKKNIEQLLKRVDIVPLKLVMAQACTESEWGKSRFAKEGYNYFGVHCYTKSCGIPPNNVSNPKFEVKSYKSPEEGIRDYLRIINTVSAYKGLRSVRAETRKQGLELEALKLTEGLSSYSQKGAAYITLLDNLIKNYLPENIEDIR